MLVTWDGSTATNQYLSPPSSHLELSHPALVDSLLLAEHNEKPYERYFQGRTQSNGRSLLGALRLNGGNWKKYAWECNFLVTPLQVALFEELVQAQQDDALPANLTDRWMPGVAVTKNCWIQIDKQYLSLVAANSWFRLQFQLLEV